MKMTRTTLINHRRIGRKVLHADRLARALSPAEYEPARNAWYKPFVHPKVIAVVCTIIIGVSALGFGVSQFYFAQAAATQKAVVDQESKLKEKRIAASACRREKAEQKADQLGKVTYDELYDYDECDK